jgi:hypothetical protein
VLLLYLLYLGLDQLRPSLGVNLLDEQRDQDDPDDDDRAHDRQSPGVAGLSWRPIAVKMV